MNGLAELLSGQEPPGIRLWQMAADPADVAEAVRAAGWRFGYVDGWAARERREVLAAIGEALAFPEHYGVNLDALADCLSELAGDTLLLWDGWSVLARGNPRGFRLLLRVLGERSAATGASPPRFGVLLRGPGPELPDVGVLA